MKKLSLFIASIACTVGVTSASAVTTEIFKGVTPPTLETLQLHNTDITVINATNDIVYMYAFNGAVDKMINSGYNGHIWDDNYGVTYVSVLNPGRYSITSGPIQACRYAIITVYGYAPSNYAINYDDELCR